MGIYQAITGEEEPYEVKAPEYKTYNSIDELEDKGMYWIKHPSGLIQPLNKKLIELIKLAFPIKATYQRPLSEMNCEYVSKKDKNKHP
jgi:hypothetical protein